MVKPVSFQLNTCARERGNVRASILAFLLGRLLPEPVTDADAAGEGSGGGATLNRSLTLGGAAVTGGTARLVS